MKTPRARKLVAALLSLTMLFSLLTLPASAAEGGRPWTA